MKVIIVDDEIHIREALDIMIDWNKFGIEKVYYAANGRAGLELIEREQPEIMFCDMEMPVMGGEELLRQITERGINIQIIAISGYDNFQYIHATLLAQGIDYLLKPFSPEKVINALERAIFKVEGEKEEHVKRRQHEQMGITMAVQVLQSLGKGEAVETGQMQEAFTKLGARREEFLTAAVLNANATRLIQDRYQGDRDIFFFAVSNMVREVFQGYEFYREIIVDDFYWQLFLQDEHPNHLKTMEAMKRLQETMAAKLGLQMTYVVSHTAVKRTDLREEVAAQSGLLQNRRIGGNGVYQEAAGEFKIPSVPGMELGIMNAMKKRNQAAVDDLIAEYCSSLRANRQMKLQDLMNCTNDMNWLLRRIASQNVSIPGQRIPPLSMWINDIDVWQYEVQNRMQLIADHYIEEKTPAEKIHSYIQENYMKDITLSTIAGYFYQTPQNIAKIFKSQYHMTVVHFILKMRMDRACELLRKDEWNITQIAEMTGYEDTNYFCRVFKKQIGMTPMQYRKKYRG